MKRIAILLFLLAMLALRMPAEAGVDEINRTLSVRGRGEAASVPNMATVSVGVVTTNASAAAALSTNNQATENILDILKQYKIAKRDVQTAQFSVSPQYKQDERGRRQSEIIGYRVMNQLRVTVRHLKELGNVIDAFIRSGSNRVSGVTFGIDDPGPILNQARSRAVADARSRAELYAKAAGVRLGKVMVISERSNEPLRPTAFRKSVALERISAVPMEVGEQTFEATIHMTFEIKDLQP